MAAQEVLHPGVEVEAQEDAPRMAEHHHEAHQQTLRAADLHRAEVRPVDLALLAGKGVEAQIGLRHRPGTLGRDQIAEVALASPVAALAGHLVEPAGGQPGPGRQGLADEGQEGVELRGLASPQLQRHPGLGDDAVDRVVMDAELARDRADLPLLGKEQAQDLGPGLLVDGHLTPFVPSAAPDRPSGRRTGRSDRSGTPWRGGRARRAGFRIAPPSCAPQQDAAVLRSKGDASLSARSRESPTPGADGVRGSGAAARHACDGPAGCPGSAAPQGAPIDAAPGRCSSASSRCCHGRSAGRENHLAAARGAVEQAGGVPHRDR